MLREDELIRRIQNGDYSGLDELVALFYPAILRYCLWHTKDRQTAEDATQETFLKAIRYLDSYAHRGKFKAFVYKIAVNVCVDISRKRTMEQLPEDLLGNDDGLEQVDAEANFSSMLRDLSNQQREVVLLRFAHDLRIREIAEVLGVPMRTVQSRLRSALKRIERDMAKGEDM